MQIKSAHFTSNTMIPARFTCQGLNVSPQLEFTQVDSRAKSLALIMQDLDSIEGKPIHWLVWDIPVTTLGFEENQVMTEFVEGLNSFDFHSYGGPCPLHSVHRYEFTLYALDVDCLNLHSSTDAKKLLKLIELHVLETCSLIGLYDRLDK